MHAANLGGKVFVLTLRRSNKSELFHMSASHATLEHARRPRILAAIVALILKKKFYNMAVCFDFIQEEYHGLLKRQ